MSNDSGSDAVAVAGNGLAGRGGETDAAIAVVSNDAAFSDALSAAVEAETGARPASASFTAWLHSDGPRRPPRATFLDLRDEESWEGLQEKIERSGASASGLVGVVGAGIPLAWLTFADRLLVGAVSFPCHRDRLCEMLARAEHLRRTGLLPSTEPPRALKSAQRTFVSFHATLYPVIDKLSIAAQHAYTLLLIGETGTGKTTLAQLLHELSPRAKKPFLVVSCGALPSDLMGSELFGHIKGAFTGADKNKVGKFEAADGGTMVLEEIDTLDLVQQAKLLRVLETGEFEPVGSHVTKKVDVRAIVTANVDLEALVAAHRFRADLYFRLKQLQFHLPPLRKRPEDIAALTLGMIDDCCRNTHLPIRHVDPEFLEMLKLYSWPGNIRDLRNEVHRAVLFSNEGRLAADGLTPDLLREAHRAREQAARGGPKNHLADNVAESEIEMIERMLRATDFNRAAAARALGISRVTLYNKIRKYGIRLDGDHRKDGADAPKDSDAPKDKQ